MAIGVAYAGVIPEKDRTRNEAWAEEYNLVEPPPSLVLLSHVFDHSKSKITPQNRLKSVIKAIYQLDTANNRRPSSKEPDSNADSIFDSNADEKSSSLLVEDEKPVVEQVKLAEFLNSESNEKEEELGELAIVDSKELNSNSDEQFNAQGTTPEIDVVPTEQTEQTTAKLGVLLEDLVDSIIHVPAHMEVDKAQKFTHSIRYGYGVPFHYNGL